MEDKHKDIAARILVAITSPKSAKKVQRMMDAGRVSIKYSLNALGTAPSEMISTLGLGSPDKIITIGMMPRFLANKMLEKMQTELHLSAVDSGIAFTVPISSGSSQFLKTIRMAMPDPSPIPDEKGTTSMEDAKYSLIAVVCTRGYSEEIMSAARTAGATGGTVINSRKIVDEEAVKFWEFSIQEERETILILASAEDKLNIMKAISTNYGLRSEAKGIVLSVPVDSVMK